MKGNEGMKIMETDFSILEGAYLRDLMAQPRALADTAAGLRETPGLTRVAAELERGDFRRVALTGMGGSYHALHPLNLRLVARGHASSMAETSELVHSMPGLLDAGTLVIAVSQSGRSVEMIRLLESGGRGHRLIGVTNTPDSPLARQADVAIHTSAGPEFSVSCKTYLAALAALEWLGDALLRGDFNQTMAELARATEAAQGYLARWKEHVRLLCRELSGVRSLFLAGRGSSLAAAGTGGLILKESARFPAEGMSSAAFRHGPFEMVRPDVFVLVFAGDEAVKNGALAQDIVKAGGKAALISKETEHDVFRLPAVAPRLRPLVEILPVQMISLALAALVGREPGRFELASKVTTVE